KLARFGLPPPFAPQPGEARRGAQLPRFRLLPPGGFERSAELTSVRCSSGGIEAQPQLRIEAMQLGFVIHDAGLRDVVERLRYQAQSLLGLPSRAIRPASLSRHKHIHAAKT